jgi:hypothetical protein
MRPPSFRIFSAAGNGGMRKLYLFFGNNQAPARFGGMSAEIIIDLTIDGKDGAIEKKTGRAWISGK